MAEQLTRIDFHRLPSGNWHYDGTWGDDRLYGQGGDDELYGWGGNDFILGAGGNERIFGGDGSDTVIGAGGNDTITGGAGDDNLRGDLGNDTINGGTGDDLIDGGDGNDTISDSSGVDRIFGGAGNDTITVTGGDWRYDQIDGGSGNDTISVTGTKVIVEGGFGDDTIKTDLSRDTLLIGGSGGDRFVITSAHPEGSGKIAEIHGGNATFFIAGWPIEGIDHVTPGTDTSVDTLDLSQWAGNGLTVSLTNGTLYGSVLLAKMDGIENVVGSSMGDTVLGNAAANEFHGLAGNDTLNGGSGNDRLFGDEGNDTLGGGANNDTLSGGIGNDTLRGGSESDTLNGEDGADKLFGDAGGDLLNGGAGIDELIGGFGNDILRGDTKGGVQSADVLTGGSDSDRFVFTDVARVLAPPPANGLGPLMVSVTDTITDFDTAGADADKIDLSALLNTWASINTSASQAVSQGYVYFVQHGAAQPGNTFYTTVMVDLNGGSHTDTANNYAVADLQGITAAEMRADLLITFQGRDGLGF